MILIFSIQDDRTTTMVMDWLAFLKKDFYVIYSNSNVEIFDISVDTKLGVDYVIKKQEAKINKVIKYSEITSVWFRRGFLSPKNFKLNIKERGVANIDIISNAFKSHLNNEYKSVVDFLYETLNEKLTLNNSFKLEINKMSTLVKAAECGLLVPYSTIITSIEELNVLKQKKSRFILKSIQALFDLNFENDFFCNYTEEFSAKIPKKIPNRFFPTLFQEMVDKDFEIRVFYIDGRCYSMAIFSQNDSQTTVDFRKYNTKKPNRTVPYKLPINVVKKIDKLMNRLGLNSGSIDIIKSKLNEYIFLEVNPVGQFGMVSAPCNYFLEKKVANFFN